MRLTFAVAGNPYNQLTIGGDTPIHRIGIGTNRIDIGRVEGGADRRD